MTASDLYWDPFRRDIWVDPYPVYKRLRAEAPVYYNEEHDFYAFARWADVDRGLPDVEHFSNARGNIYEFIKSGIEMPPGSVIFEDPPSHGIHRRLVSRLFSPGGIRSLESKIRDYVVRQLEPVQDGAGFDVIDILSDKVPMRVIGMLVGIPEEMQQSVRDRTVANLTTEEGGKLDAEASQIGTDIFEGYIDWRIANPSEDIMTKLLNAEFEDHDGTTRGLTREEILVYCAVISGAGNETTGQLMGWIGKVFGEEKNHRQYQEVVANPSLAGNAVEEVLRLEPVGQAVGRYVRKDVEFHGQTIPEGSTALFLVGSAGRDEAKFENPDVLDIHRDITAQRSFGYGLHYCLGANLARMEGRIVLEELVKRFPKGWDVDLSGARIASTTTVRGWEKLPIVLRK
ncbi:cytochrome P450 [Frankia sp. EI5c]|uniref:cytochrome P450 n=1 Tax=Frankia sp. EI5c TaxID=683316 RepID=UPI0007C3DB27|nr:cytochrome P450 [Frankia sp. EI5c]OAA27483.1 cytochrome P450 [Frankia sp. EI5c]